jgi:hypothetical protein
MMRLSEVMARLADVLKQHGDVPVMVEDGLGPVPVASVAFDSAGPWAVLDVTG